MKIHNILWHLNGTLFDTFPALTYSFSKVLSEMGFSVALNVIDGLIRQSLDDCVDMLSGRFKLDPDQLRHKFVGSYRNISPASQTPFPGVRNICELIHDNGGSNLALTDTDLESANRLFEAHCFSGLIAETFLLKKADAKQTYPSLISAALDKHSLSPNETLIVGVRSLDVQAGRLAGVRTCLYGKAEATLAADLQIEKYSELHSLLAGEEGK